MSKKSEKPAADVETKSLTIEVKATGEGVIEAYAAAFGVVDSYGDDIQRGAFTKTIAERKDKIKVLYNHDYYSNLPVGKPLALSEDSYGLLTSTKMSQTQMGQDIYTLAKEEALDSMSIGYSAMKAEYPDEEEYRRTGIWRRITETKLWEYSFVPFPANESAIITGIKSGADLEREIKRWRNIMAVNLSSKAGRVLSSANAKKILTALAELQDLVSAAGLDEAADEGTSGSATAEKSSTEPPKHSLLSALEAKAKALDTEVKKGGLLSELRAFGASLGGD